MVVKQCLNCKNSNPQCRQSFVLYLRTLLAITDMVNDGNKDSKFFKENQREYNFDIKCNKYIKAHSEEDMYDAE